MSINQSAKTAVPFRLNSIAKLHFIRKESRKRYNRGITLTELLVASIMIGIVMIGVASFSTTVIRLQSSTDKTVILSMRAKAAMAQLTQDAQLATGDITNLGVRADPNGGGSPKRSICFRVDALETPENYGDDSWSCYFVENQLILWKCAYPTNPSDVPVNNANKCDGAGTKKKLLDLTDKEYYQIVNDGDGRLQYVKFSLSTIFDSALAVDPVTNPKYTLTTQVSPLAHSR